MGRMKVFYRGPLNPDARQKIAYVGPRKGGGINLSLVFDNSEAGNGWANDDVSEIKDYLEALSNRRYILAFCDSPYVPGGHQIKYLQLKKHFREKQLLQG